VFNWDASKFGRLRRKTLCIRDLRADLRWGAPRVFFPNSRQSGRRRPTSRGHADPTDRIAKRFYQRLALVVEVSLLGDVIEIEGIGIGLVREQPATAARLPAAFLETKIPISPLRCSLRDKPENEMRFVAAHVEDSRAATIFRVELIVIRSSRSRSMKEYKRRKADSASVCRFGLE
jgi:hypothetical protein